MPYVFVSGNGIPVGREDVEFGDFLDSLVSAFKTFMYYLAKYGKYVAAATAIIPGIGPALSGAILAASAVANAYEQATTGHMPITEFKGLGDKVSPEQKRKFADYMRLLAMYHEERKTPGSPFYKWPKWDESNKYYKHGAKSKKEWGTVEKFHKMYHATIDKKLAKMAKEIQALMKRTQDEKEALIHSSFNDIRDKGLLYGPQMLRGTHEPQEGYMLGFLKAQSRLGFKPPANAAYVKRAGDIVAEVIKRVESRDAQLHGLGAVRGIAQHAAVPDSGAIWRVVLNGEEYQDWLTDIFHHPDPEGMDWSTFSLSHLQLMAEQDVLLTLMGVMQHAKVVNGLTYTKQSNGETVAVMRPDLTTNLYLRIVRTPQWLDYFYQPNGTLQMLDKRVHWLRQLYAESMTTPRKKPATVSKSSTKSKLVRVGF